MARPPRQRQIGVHGHAASTPRLAPPGAGGKTLGWRTPLRLMIPGGNTDMATRRFRWLALLLAFSFFAAACGGEVSEDADLDADTGNPDDSADPEPDPDPDADPDPVVDDEPNFHTDPRGGVFQEFQSSFDRGNHPFTQLDNYCLPHDEAADRIATDEGISEDEINIGHIRSTLEDAEAFGMFVPVGDPKDMVEVFVDYINTECGGVRGRQLNLGYAEAAIIADTETSRNAACLSVTEDHHSVIVMNVTGFSGTANLCIVEDQETPFISTQGQNAEFTAAGGDRLLSVSLGLERSMRVLVDDLVTSGALDGKSLGAIVQDTPGHADSLDVGLVQPLRDAGFEVTVAVVACNGSSICTGGVPEVVTEMKDANVDVFFNVMGVFTAPAVIGEMANQGFAPGDIQFYATDFQSQAAELVSAQIANTSDAAGQLYNGAIIVNHRATGENRVADHTPAAFDEMCSELYNANNGIGASHAWNDLGDSAYGMNASVCAQLRLISRAIYDAGENPTPADIETALINIGPWDVGAMLPASFAPGKTESPDAIQTLDFTYPCDQALPFDNGEVKICITGRGDWRPAG